MYIAGARWLALGVYFHWFDEVADPLLSLKFPPLQASNDDRKLVRPAGMPTGERQCSDSLLDRPPALRLASLRGERLAGLANGAAGESGAPAQPLHPIAFDPRGGRDAYEFVVAQCERGEVKAEGLDDPLCLGIAAAIALALLAVANHEDAGFEEGPVELLDARGDSPRNSA